MNYGISVLFRAIPILMGAISAGLGSYVWVGASGPEAHLASRVLVMLAAICLCLFATAATIIRQLIGRFNALDRWAYPMLGFAITVVTSGYGLWMVFRGGSSAPEYTAGHVVFGVGLVCGCVSTVATSSTRFT